MEALSTSPFCSWQNWRKAYFKFLIKILSCCVRSPDGIPQGSWMGFWLNYNWPDCVNISFKCCELKTAINNNLNNKKHYFTFNPLLPQLIQITCLVTGKKKKKREQNQPRNKEPSRNHCMGTGDDYSHHPWSQKHFAWRWWLCIRRCCRTALMKHGCVPDLPFIQYPTLTWVSVQSHLR